jgi:anti-anti-sigma factor
VHAPFFSVALEQRDPPTFVVAGELDVATVPRLCRVVELLLGIEPELAIDLAAVDFVDLIAARRLARLHAAAGRRGTIIVVTGATRPVELLFDRLGLTDVLAPTEG